MLPSSRQDFGYSRTVSYSNRDHLSLILQKWGSVHPKVLPFCLANIALTIFLVWLLDVANIDLSISEFGHEFMSILVAFLVINKLSFTLGLYYELQGSLAKMNQASIELTQLACSYTKDSTILREWRYKVCYEALVLLKATVSVIKGGGDTEALISELLPHSPHSSSSLKNQRTVPQQIYEFGHDSPSDQNLRLPLRLAHRLRDTVMEHRDNLDSIREGYMLESVKEIMSGYYGIRKYLTCPLPLPLVQLGRIFVLFYVFTLPFALLSPALNLPYSQMTILIGLMTYGFMGIELLFVEIDDPFGDDANDLPITEEARAAAEDVILNLRHVDGEAAANRLKEAVAPKRQTNGSYAKETDSLL